jgi:hypothetical protein
MIGSIGVGYQQHRGERADANHLCGISDRLGNGHEQNLAPRNDAPEIHLYDAATESRLDPRQ